MLPKINGKDLLDCTEVDFGEIIDNLDYRENEYLDYKEMVDVLAIPKDKKDAIANAKAEFRSDVCSFANANGGYILFGIEEDSKSVPKAIKGITIKNDDTDHFELDIKNWLQTIRPRIPNYKISFVEVQNDKYVVILYIYHDYFAPYIHLEDNKNYRIYKRVGNSKVVVGYSELKNMFNNSLSLEKEVERFRRERIDYYRMQEDTKEYTYSKFMMLHIIPETFLDSSYDKPVYLMNRIDDKLSSLFYAFRCYEEVFPIIEGMRYTGYENKVECRLYNSGIAECFYPFWGELGNLDSYVNGYIPWLRFWDRVKSTLYNYSKTTNSVFDTQRVFICISIIGCKGAVTEKGNADIDTSIVDRNYLAFTPVAFENIYDDKLYERDIIDLEIEFILSLGIRYHTNLKKLIEKRQKYNDSLKE